MLAALNFRLMHEFYAPARGSARSLRAHTSGLGSARCRKICSLKRHVPFDALYIIHKVKAVTVPFCERSPYLEENAERSISRPNSDNLRWTLAIAISIIVAHAHRLYSGRRHRSALSQLSAALTVSAQTPFGRMRLLSMGLWHFVSVVSRLLRFRSTRQIAGRTGCRGTRHVDALLA